MPDQRAPLSTSLVRMGKSESEDLAAADVAPLGRPADGVDDHIHLMASRCTSILSFGATYKVIQRRDKSPYAPLSTVVFTFTHPR